jgi:hypothetical protein
VGGLPSALNLISWNDPKANYDIHPWAPDGPAMGKGVTLTKEELAARRDLLPWLQLIVVKPSK